MSKSTEKAKQSFWQVLKKPPWRTVVPAFTLLFFLVIGRALWMPGANITDGRHDLGRNGVWLQHGWLGHDSWFTENGKTDRLPQFRSRNKVQELAVMLKQQHISDVFPHLCPTLLSGEILPVDDQQTERFLNEFAGFRVLPWVGGVLDADVDPDDSKRRKVFVQSLVALLRKHPRLAGVHLNVEPWPSGNNGMLTLLDEIRKALPPGKMLSVAAYPPPAYWHPHPEVHWEEAYFKEVAKRVDQMAVMMYDTALRDDKLYQNLMRSWTKLVLGWTAELDGHKPPTILLGVPTYDDAGSGYHNPEVENLGNALLGIHSGLMSRALPVHYQGVAVYSEWEINTPEWQYWQRHFTKP